MPKSGKRVVAGRPSSLSQLSKRKKWSEANRTRKPEQQAVPITDPELKRQKIQAPIRDLTSASGHTSKWSKDGQSTLSKRALATVFHCDFSIRTPSDTDQCFLNSMITMPDDRIIIVDRYNDYKLKLFSENYSLLDEIQCKFCLTVTCVDNSTIAVVAGLDIVTYSVTNNKLRKIERKEHIGGILYDIAYRQGDYIRRYQTPDGMDCLCYGKKVISKEKRTSVQYDNMCYDFQHDYVLVGYFGEKIIKCLTIDGELKWSMTIEGRQHGIIVVHDRILVTVRNDNTVREMTLEGQLVHTSLLTSKDLYGIEKPEILAYQRKQGRLIVGSVESDVVKVFNLTR